MSDVLQVVGGVACLAGPFVVLAIWTALADDLQNRSRFVGLWWLIVLLQGVLCAPGASRSWLGAAALGSCTSWLTGAVLALNFGPYRRTELALVLFAVAWFMSQFLGLWLALVLGELSI
jgi:hypothetical protein